MTRDSRDPLNARFDGAPALEASRAPVAGPGLGGPLNAALKFPRTLQTEADSPLLLGALLGDADDRLEFARINGVPIGTDGATPLPGIRVGYGDGSGFVFRRELDGELVFVPDSEFRGITTFGYTVVDRQGAEATLIARVIVEPDAVLDAVEGFDGASLGTVEGNAAEFSDALAFCVDEAPDGTRPDQSLVAGGGLDATKLLDFGQGEAVLLRLVGDQDTTRGNIDAGVHWNDARQGSVPSPIERDDFFRFLEGVTEQQWDGFEEGEDHGSGVDVLEIVGPNSLTDWLMPLDEKGSAEPFQVRLQSTGEPFGD